ncbi:hypothetical protein AXA44_25580 [Rhodococcus sp. SC4]|nr:hypothetical protein AXA44_25580 [Rhodococcus sp. SC4]
MLEYPDRFTQDRPGHPELLTQRSFRAENFADRPLSFGDLVYDPSSNLDGELFGCNCCRLFSLRKSHLPGTPIPSIRAWTLAM